jgi:hypothetical protein
LLRQRQVESAPARRCDRLDTNKITSTRLVIKLNCVNLQFRWKLPQVQMPTQTYSAMATNAWVT